MPTRFLLADDDELVRDLIRRWLCQRKDWEICAEASDGIEAVDQARATHPDVAILDISMPKQNGIEAGRKIVGLSQTTVVLTISIYDSSMVFGQLIEAGIQGFVSKLSIGAELIPAVEALLRGETYFTVSQNS